MPLMSFQSAADVVSIVFIAAVLLLSVLSLCFVLRLRLKKPTSEAAAAFNSLWTVRLLLVSLISLWSLSHLLRLLASLHHRLRPVLCKFHLILSFGLLQPAFLVTILYLVNASVRKRTPGSAAAFVSTAVLPILALQILSLHSPVLNHTFIPRICRKSSVLHQDELGHASVVCAYPVFGTLIFAAFGVCFLIFFWLACWRVVSVVINKGLRVRIYVLAFGVSISLSMEIVFLGLSALMRPGEAGHAAAALVVFLGALLCAVAGEGILVIRPIAEALAASEGGCYGGLDTRRRCTLEMEDLEGGRRGGWSSGESGGETKGMIGLS